MSMQCRSKKRKFRTELDARIVLSRLIAHDRDESRVYSCSMCKGYHITSQPKNLFNPHKVDAN